MKKPRQLRLYTDLPNALDPQSDLINRLKNFKIAAFFDYDGTLTSISEHPQKAVLSEEMRAALAKLANKAVVAVVSGRDKANLQNFIKLPQLFYIGNHGFDVEGSNTVPFYFEIGGEFTDDLPRFSIEMESALAGIPGAWVEPKKFTAAVHYRTVAAEDENKVIQLTKKVIGHYPKLKIGSGKKVLEIRPNIDWGKGDAVDWIANKLDLNQPTVFRIYLGDDITDEDAFRMMPEQGAGILVGNHGQKTYADYGLTDPLQVLKFINKLI